jgi:glutathione synthase/RimK-type ligase-like ATP-grasp enzyme
MNFAAIKRANEYSPNHIMNDFGILKSTADELVKLGATVNFYDESILEENLIPENYIFSMVQGRSGIDMLRKIEKNKCFAINSADAVFNCYRFNMVTKLPQAGIPFPESIVIDSNSTPIDVDVTRFGKKFWIKRGDAHAVHKEDVTLVYDKAEANNVIKEFSKRGIQQAVIQENLVGDTVKFYSVAGSDLFHWYHLNGDFHTPFDENRLRELATASAEILGLQVYGGDAIITRNSDIIIIDINDWPSFAPVRDRASFEIAKLLYKKGMSYE